MKMLNLLALLFVVSLTTAMSELAFADPVVNPGVDATAQTTASPTNTVVASGRVLDSASKRPVVGVRVDVDDLVDGSDIFALPQSVHATTDQNGQFTVTLLPGTARIYLTDLPKGYASNIFAAQQTVTVVGGHPLTLDPILIRHVVTVSGTAVDEFGKPLPNILLEPQTCEENDYWMQPTPVTTGTSGQFIVDQCLPGRYFIDPGANWTVVSPMFIDAPSNAPIKLILKKAQPTTLQGTVVDTSGAPLPGVTVDFKALLILPGRGEIEMDHWTKATTNSGGFFSVPEVPAGVMPDVSGIAKEGYLLKSGGDITNNGGRPTISRIVMAELGAQLSGIVRNSLNEPVGGAWVGCANGGGDVRPVQTDATGSFHLEGLLSGPVDLYAAKGSYFGHLTTEAAVAGSQSVTITLGPNPAPPVQVDIPGAIKILNEQYTLAKSSASSDLWQYCDECAYVLEAMSPAAGFDFLAQNTTINSRDVCYIAPAQSSQNPTAFAKLLVPLLSTIPDNGYAGSVAATVGLDAAPYDLGTATTLYHFAASKISLDNLDLDNYNDKMNLVALAYAVQSPDADADYEKVCTEIQSVYPRAGINASDQSNNDELTSRFAKILARANLTSALKILPTLSQNVQSSTTSEIVSELVQTAPDGALTAFRTLDPYGLDGWDYIKAFAVLLPVLYKIDPEKTLAHVEKLGDPEERLEALTYIADQLPLTEATPIYEQAEADSADQFGRSPTPASIAAHAFLRDKNLGAALFAEAFNKVIDSPPVTQDRLGPSYAEFAFYYARYDPGYSRVLLEDQFGKDNVSTPDYRQEIGLSADVAAMASIDPARALEMAASIKDFEPSFEAALTVAQYLTFPQPTRDTLPFNAWVYNNLWTPRVGQDW